MRITAAVLVLALLGACADTSKATTVAPVVAASTTTALAPTTVAQTEAVSVSGPSPVDRDGNPMLGGAGPWEVVQVISGDSLDVRKETLLVAWRLA